jgi:hypothetical protein
MKANQEDALKCSWNNSPAGHLNCLSAFACAAALKKNLLADDGILIRQPISGSHRRPQFNRIGSRRVPITVAGCRWRARTAFDSNEAVRTE